MAGQSSKKYEVLSSASWFVQDKNGFIVGKLVAPNSPDDFRQGDIIEGVERLIKYRVKSKEPSGWMSGVVIDIGSDKYGRKMYVWRNQLIPYAGSKPVGESGNFSGAEEASKKWDVISDSSIYKLLPDGVLIVVKGLFKQGDIIEGRERTISFKGGMGNVYQKMNVIEMIHGGFVKRKNVVPHFSGKPVGGTGNFSGVDGASESTAPPILIALPSILSSVGFIWGLSYAFSKQKKFWGYVGYSFLGSVGGATVGGLIAVIAYPQSVKTHGADGSGRSNKSSLFKSKIKGKCTCPDGQRYPCTGADSCRECCKEALSFQKQGCLDRGGVSCCRPKRWRFNYNSYQYECL